MAVTLFDVQVHYTADENLKKDDVHSLMEWANKEPDLPNINELQTILFLHSCYYSNEATKATMKNFFKFRSQNPEIFTNRDPSSLGMTAIMNHTLVTPLPRRTPEDFAICFIKILESDSKNFNLLDQIKYIVMVFTNHLHSERVSSGHLLLIDIQGLTLGHLLKLRPLLLKKFFYYLQEALPVRLKGLHFFNVVPLMDKLLVLVKPFLKRELLEVLYLHDSLDSLQKFVPIDCLPEDYGGSVDSVSHLHEQIKDQLVRNAEFLTED